MAVPVRGGPADGLAVGRAGLLRWIDPARGRGFRARAPGRSLYRLERDAYVYVGRRTTVCLRCGALTTDRTASPWCYLCGGTTTSSDA